MNYEYAVVGQQPLDLVWYGFQRKKVACNTEKREKVLQISLRYSQGRYRVRRYLEGVGFAVLILLGSLAVISVLVASSIGMNFLMRLVFDADSQTFELFQLISSIFLIGAGLTIAAAGSIVAILETGASLLGYMQMLRGQDEADV